MSQAAGPAPHLVIPHEERRSWRAWVAGAVVLLTAVAWGAWKAGLRPNKLWLGQTVTLATLMPFALVAVCGSRKSGSKLPHSKVCGGEHSLLQFPGI